jgi:hypothetical protein
MARRRCASLKSTRAGAELLLSFMPASPFELPQPTSRVRKGMANRTPLALDAMQAETTLDAGRLVVGSPIVFEYLRFSPDRPTYL